MNSAIFTLNAPLPGRLRRNLSTICKDYQFIQKSRVPSFHFQKSLPRLPIPALDKSCERYLRAQKPLLNDEEYHQVGNIVQRFCREEGPELQKELIRMDKNNKHTSYISKPWFEMYLADRRPLPINYNPFLVFINDPRKEYNSQLIRATNLVVSSLRFLNSLRADLIEPEVYHLDAKKSDTPFFWKCTGALPSSISWYGAYLFKAFPLDMSQYHHLFNTSRIPQQGMDTLYHEDNSKYITVMKGGKVYLMTVLDESGRILDAPTILSSINFILSQTSVEAHPLGIMTTENRNTWADMRKHLESTGNHEALKAIDGGIFNLVLDDNELPETDYVGLIREYLHSDGKNRWFDKSFSLIVNKAGIAGVNFEHSWGDGIAVLRYFQDIYKDSTENAHVHPDTSANSMRSEDLVEELAFKLDDKSKASIEAASERYQTTTSSLGIEVHEFKSFGRNLCKSHKLSPDFLMQLSFQMAHYKLNNYFVSTYESCSTSAFKHGRTETMRPLTVEAKELVLSLAKKNNNESKDSLISKMKAASEVHGTLIKEAAMGQGFDRHMFALRLLAEKRGQVPDIFTHPSYKKMNHYILSTSTLSSDVVMLGAFGPVVPDGFGIGYSIWNDRLGAIVSNYKPHTNGSALISCWQDSLNELHNILK